MTFGISINRKMRLSSPNPSDEQTGILSRLTAESLRQRIAIGKNAEGKAAKPLNANYALGKVRRGLKPIRDWRFTGAMMADFGVMQESGGISRIGFSSEQQRTKAARNQKIERMIGFDPDTRSGIVTQWAAQVRENLKTMVQR